MAAHLHQEAPSTGEVPFAPPPVPEGAPAAYVRFWQLWGEERFFACHEVLEELWRQTPGPDRWFYNGLIHCAVALYQHRRGNAVGAARQWVRARAKLRAFRPCYRGVHINGLLEGVERAIEPSLNALSPAHRARLAALEESVRRRMDAAPDPASRESH